MRKTVLSVLLSLALTAEILSGGPVAASVTSGEELMEVSIPDTVVDRGTSFVRPVLVHTSTTGENIISYDFRLIYDPEILSFDQASTRGTLSDNFSVLPNQVAPGTLVVAAAGVGPMSGQGVLINLEFESLPESQGSTLLAFQQFNFNEGNPPVSLTNGEVEITNIPPSDFQMISPEGPVNLHFDDSNLDNELSLTWEPSFDEEGQTVRYGFLMESDSLRIVPVRTVVTNHLEISYARFLEILKNLDTTYFIGQWSLFATDGYDTTTVADGPFPLAIQAEVSAMDPGIRLPETTRLDQNYPNPFNSGTVITYQLRKPSQVALNIYDTGGRLITSLVNEHQSAGEYQIRWNGKDDNGNSVSTGIYFYRLASDGKVFLHKMLYVK